jgi:S-layer homology domain
MRGKSDSWKALAVWAAMIVLALPAAAARGADEKPTNREQLARFHSDWIAAGRPAAGTATLEPKFGIQEPEYINIHAYAFQANTLSDLILDDGNGYRYFGATAVPFMAAPVQVPSGAVLESLTLSACSAHQGDLVVGLFDNGVGGSGGGGGTNIGGFLPGDAGCAKTSIGLGDTTYVRNLDHPLYLVIHFVGDETDGSTKFNDVFLGFRRQVSPAPATASFGDVPTSDPAFQYVEALVASGITAGCAGGNYCPDNFVTRRQMAVFLAKALGLHWPF